VEYLSYRNKILPEVNHLAGNGYLCVFLLSAYTTETQKRYKDKEKCFCFHLSDLFIADYISIFYKVSKS